MTTTTRDDVLIYMQLHHVQLVIMDGELYLAPIGNPGRVLDVGTGTGRVSYTRYHIQDPEFADTPCSIGMTIIA